MDFFAQQAHAQRQTRLLLMLFMLALLAIVVAVNLAMALIFIWTAGASPGYPRGFFLTNTLVTVALIGGGSAIEILRLREGGDAVARMAGGRLILSTSRQPQERRLQNVVEEMAIAAGIACPRIYVMERESAINAFAAGFDQNEAVIAVTRGTLERLNRDELQGVVAHEFSHILNGDMRLNMRLIGVLSGIQMIAGFGRQLMDAAWVFRSDSRKTDSRSSIWLVGAALYAVGYIGVFFGRLIKSAVSRQREFLADSSAVQFTRNPDGIGNALRKIGGLSRVMPLGSRIDSPQAEQLSHFFLCAARPALLAGLFATHPPLEERLRRIYGRNIGLLDAPVLEESQFSIAEALPDLQYVAAPTGEDSLALQHLAASNPTTPPPLVLRQAPHDPRDVAER